MLAVGMADGNVAVYNLQKNTGKPTYISTAKNGKHQDIVWQVKAIDICGKSKKIVSVFYRLRRISNFYSIGLHEEQLTR